MINLAVVGCGRMASELAKRSVDMGRAKITAIHDPNPDNLAKACETFQAAPVDEITGLLGRPDIDAYLIGSPGFYHHENVLALAKDKKPIYSEKPLSTTVPLCNAMIDICKEYHVKLFVGQVLRLFPLFWKSKEIIDSGVVGAARLCSVTRSGRGEHYATGWRSSLKQSGGPLLETHSHELDYLLFLLGKPAKVFAQGLNLNGWGDYQDSLFVQITFESGALGMLYGSNASPIGEYRVHIQCETGNIVHGGFGGELKYQSMSDDKPTIVPASDLSYMPNPYDRELTSFFDWIEKDTPPLFTGETGRANVAIADAALKSMADGNAVDMYP